MVRTGRPALEWPKEDILRWYSEGMTLKEIAVQVDRSANGVWKFLIREGIPRRADQPRPGKGHFYNGGRTIQQGYVRIYRPDHPNASNGYVHEHRLVIEEYLGRNLDRSEVVHHIDGNKQNNRIENLELFACNADHLRSTLSGSRPNWTPEGFDRMRAPRGPLTDDHKEKLRLARRRYVGRQRDASQPESENDASLSPSPIGLTEYRIDTTE